MKIFILNPNFNLESKHQFRVRERQPLSLAIIAASLRNNGHKIHFLDANVLNYSLGWIIKEINEINPDVLLLTSSPVDRWECPDLHLENVFKIINSTVVKYKMITGSHGTIDPDWIFKNSKIDFVVRSEPEQIVNNLIKNLSKSADLSELKGISWRQGNQIFHNEKDERIPDLDNLPFPAYGLLPMGKYADDGFEQPFSIMLTSRGCPYHCTFCLKAMAPGQYITRSPDNVLKEIGTLINDFKIKSIYFQDWEFLIDLKRVENICRLIINNNFKFQWAANARATDINKAGELLDLMKQAGCFKINIGLESANDKILLKINKKITKNDLQTAIDLLKKKQMAVGYYMLINCPGEDKETIKETVDFIIANDLKVKKINPVIPYPGTAIFNELKIQNPGLNINWDNVENYAGLIDTKLKPKTALNFFRHYKYQKLYGQFYFFKPAFWKFILKK